MASIDSQIALVYSQYWDQVQQKGKLGQKFLIVEGDDDRIMIESLLAQQSVTWSQRAVVAAAFGRSKVLTQLKRHPDWYGLVDRDTWTDAQVAAVKAEYPNLEVTEGWCLENHILQATLLEAVLSLQSGSLTNLSVQMAPWLSYGAIRWVMKQCRDEFSVSLMPEIYGRPDKLPTEPHDRNSIEARLMSRGYAGFQSKWQLSNLLDGIEARKTAVLSLPPDKQILLGIHGKEFFRIEVTPALNRALKQQPEDRWRAQIADRLRGRWPAYLVTHIRKLL